jgi:hypothetical protein
MEPDRSKSRRQRRKGGLKGMHQDLASYLGFGVYSTSFLALFVVLYSIMLLILVPLLRSTAGDMSLEESLKDAPAPVLEAVEVASKLRGRWRQLRHLSGVTDETLLEETIQEFDAHKVILEARHEFMKHIH